jgi:putative endonuclease
MTLFKRRFHLKSILGRKGEDAASRFLRRQGIRVVERNYKNETGRALGEIDIVARDGDELVFVEVKARTVESNNDMPPESAITPGKLYRLGRIAEAYIRERNETDTPYRFDALSVRYYTDGSTPEIRHLRNIFL